MLFHFFVIVKINERYDKKLEQNNKNKKRKNQIFKQREGHGRGKDSEKYRRPVNGLRQLRGHMQMHRERAGA